MWAALPGCTGARWCFKTLQHQVENNNDRLLHSSLTTTDYQLHNIESEGINRIPRETRLHPERNLDVCIQFPSNPSSSSKNSKPQMWTCCLQEGTWIARVGELEDASFGNWQRPHKISPIQRSWWLFASFSFISRALSICMRVLEGRVFTADMFKSDEPLLYRRDERCQYAAKAKKLTKKSLLE